MRDEPGSVGSDTVSSWEGGTTCMSGAGELGREGEGRKFGVNNEPFSCSPPTMLHRTNCQIQAKLKTTAAGEAGIKHQVPA